MALGAQPGDVLKLVMREGVYLALIGVALGLVAVASASRLMKSLLFGGRPTRIPASVAVLLMLVALLFVTSRRVARRGSIR